MLDSLVETDDAVQDAWVRLSRADAREIENLGAWLTTVVARVALNMLRSHHDRFDGCLPLPESRQAPCQGLGARHPNAPSLPSAL
jgi:DNA-directed RNA polymerase specialized sigma24 family protein